MTGRRRFAAFSLIELLIVVAIMGIVVALVVPNLNPDLHDQLQSVARVVAGDIAYGRSLAVANSSNYRFTFDAANNRYILRHSGANSSLNVLPDSTFRSPTDPPDQYIVDLAALPRLGGHNVRLLAVTGPKQAIINSADLEFGPLGETTRSQETRIWLVGGRGTATRYVAIHVNPVTGLTSFGQFTGLAPLSSPSGSVNEQAGTGS